MELNKNQESFFALVRAGLWESEVRLSQYEEIDFNEIYRLATEQSVIGLVTAGLEHVADVKMPRMMALQLAGQTMQIEQRNKEMNLFIADLIAKMQNADIYVLLVKGQGVAQCYEKPLWRSSGDIDLFLDSKNYVKAQKFLSPNSQNKEESPNDIMHTEMTINGWIVELHGTMRTQLGHKIDIVVDKVQENAFTGHRVRTWRNERVDVMLPCPDDDIVFVFTHFLQHLFIGGCGLRQICDWCRLLWTYRGTLDVALLEKRLKNAGLLSEWKAFGALAVIYLGMPEETMPLYSSAKKWHRKADKILHSILMMGNMGHNRDMSYRQTDSGVLRKLKTFHIITKDACRLAAIFPMDSVRVWWILNVREIKKHV